jgi:hypothetical protein
VHAYAVGQLLLLLADAVSNPKAIKTELAGFSPLKVNQ